MRIPRQNLLTFASQAGKHKLKKQTVKWCQPATPAWCQLFGSILYHSLQQNIDMAKVLKYPLTTVPLSLSHVDGTMQTTPKATLMNHLESEVTSTPPPSINTTIIDVSFFLNLRTNFSLLPSFILFYFILNQQIHRTISCPCFLKGGLGDSNLEKTFIGPREL